MDDRDDGLPDDWVSPGSSAVAEAKYDRSRGVLVVRFQKGRKDYDYPMPPEQARAFFAAPSKGVWLARNFPSRRG